MDALSIKALFALASSGFFLQVACGQWSLVAKSQAWRTVFIMFANFGSLACFLVAIAMLWAIPIH